MSTDSTSKPSKATLRPPAPSLFIGPPSRNASHADLRPPPGQTFPSSTRVPLLRQRTHPNPLASRPDSSGGPSDSTNSPATPATPLSSQRLGSGGGVGPRPQARTTATTTTLSEGGAAGGAHAQKPSTDEVWAEMQNTLEEVELNGVSGANVFGAGHARALEELRRAQIELAQAWARGEADDAANGAGEEEGRFGDDAGEAGDVAGILGEERKGNVGGAAPAAKEGKAREKEEKERTELDRETENDILLARKRRVANDRYFERVNKGVVDVVERLEIVAKMMAGVEMESQEIWGDKDSIDTGGSVT